MTKAHENPFRSERIDNQPYLENGSSLDQIAARFDSLGRCAAIVGPHGSGKTALLAALRRSLGKDVLCLDGAGRTSLIQTWMLARHQRRRGAGLIVTAHAPLMFIPTLIRCRPTLDLSVALTKRIAPEIPPCEIAALHTDCAGNLHEMFRRLYLRAAGSVDRPPSS